MKNNISSKFKYTIDLGVQATKTTFKLRKSRKDKVVHILVLAFIAIMAGVMVWDIVREASFTIDLIILIALCAMELFSLTMPLIIVGVQRRFLKKLDLSQFDYTITEFSKDKCLESYYKDDKIVMQNVCNINKLESYKISDQYVFVVFSNFACAIFDTATLSVEVDQFIGELDKIIARNKASKTKR